MFEFLRSAKVYDFNGASLIWTFNVQKYVLRLQISVTYTLLMAIWDSRQDLFDDASGILLAKAGSFGYLVKELASCAKFCHEIKPFLVLENLIETHNVGMVKLPHNVYFRKEPNLFLGIQCVLSDNLHCSDWTWFLIRTFSYFSKSTYLIDSYIMYWITCAEDWSKWIKVSKSSFLFCNEIALRNFEVLDFHNMNISLIWCRLFARYTIK